jgi:hypothetical protein
VVAVLAGGEAVKRFEALVEMREAVEAAFEAGLSMCLTKPVILYILAFK